MNIIEMIAAYNNFLINSEQDAKVFLNQYTEEEQAAFITALYIGRDHLYYSQIGNDYFINSIPNHLHHTYNNIPTRNFPRILFEKDKWVKEYLRKFLECMKNSNLLDTYGVQY